jgi:hypothetical protein
MRYVAAAFNRHDLRALREMMTPSNAVVVDAMHDEAVDLRFVSCAEEEGMGLGCTFSHAFPKGRGHGTAWMQVSFDRRLGWYVSGTPECG